MWRLQQLQRQEKLRRESLPGGLIATITPLPSQTSIKLLLLALVVHLSAASRHAEAASATASPPPPTTSRPDHDQQRQQLHPSLFVDTKFWIKNTEFGEQQNWLNQVKPCTLLERIQFDESAVVSMGASFDALGQSLESNIRELLLASNSVLLLEENTIDEPLDPLFVQYLNLSGDCFDTNGKASRPTDDTFRFKPHSDDMSWFNPANWASALNEDGEVGDWVPDSHLIPCQEDVVVFGSRRESLWTVLEASERGQTLSFKVNFRPSRAMQEQLANVSVPAVRVSKFRIGDKILSQEELNLLTDEMYKDLLFDLDKRSSMLEFRADSGRFVLIDQSSIQESANFELCQDEAGCLCGNEATDVMQLICSFNEPLEPRDLPCHDPIGASGYCNKICATVLIITMDPNRFSERYLGSMLNNALVESEEANRMFSTNIFLGARRTDHHKYEITFRLVTAGSMSSYEDAIGEEIEFAEIIKQKLEIPATKSFYGIKSIQLDSSRDWKRSNRLSTFCLSFSVFLGLIVIVEYTKLDSVKFQYLFATKSLYTLLRCLSQSSNRGAQTGYDAARQASDRANSFESEQEQPLAMDGSIPNIALVDLDSALSSSTTNLLEST